MTSPPLGNLFPDLKGTRRKRPTGKWELTWFDAEPHAWPCDNWDQLGRVLHRLTCEGFKVEVRKIA